MMESPAKGQSVELHAEEVNVVGTCDPEEYPLQKKKTSLETLREMPHLRPRSNTIGAVSRVRSTASSALHRSLEGMGFAQVHTPIITSSDCEGAGEMFSVGTTQGEEEEPGFFGKPAYMTVSGQLHAEMYACALSRVYSFGPTFRAENSNTSRHLAEFWMLEPEMAFADMQDAIQVASTMLKEGTAGVLERCDEDMAFLHKQAPEQLHSLQQLADTGTVPQLSYTEACEALRQSGASFEQPLQWGEDLRSEHEQWLAGEYCKGPVFVTDWPEGIKPFYMRCSEDGSTVDGFDLLVPRVGELMGGGAREERLEQLLQRMQKMGLDPTEHAGYVDLRRFGSVPHAGFGVGFERLVMYLTGLSNARDVIPFPRAPQSCAF
eukprot:TRINITY_DN40203_c0_g1_i1.p1 TRINITY_DN40203_c0_g1~~TRINITY_DN40203_c0_g1_i1.p1  ORF type:complete len:377 (+),score=98.05 TRINITY_DN40203_c0_g1_i1:241-1371(+)